MISIIAISDHPHQTLDRLYSEMAHQTVSHKQFLFFRQFYFAVFHSLLQNATISKVWHEKLFTDPD